MDTYTKTTPYQYPTYDGEKIAMRLYSELHDQGAENADWDDPDAFAFSRPRAAEKWISEWAARHPEIKNIHKRCSGGSLTIPNAPWCGHRTKGSHPNNKQKQNKNKMKPMTCAQVRDAIVNHLADGGVVLDTYGLCPAAKLKGITDVSERGDLSRIELTSYGTVSTTVGDDIDDFTLRDGVICYQTKDDRYGANGTITFLRQAEPPHYAEADERSFDERRVTAPSNLKP